MKQELQQKLFKNYPELDDDYNICGLCREEDNEEHITRDKNDDDIKRNR